MPKVFMLWCYGELLDPFIASILALSRQYINGVFFMGLTVCWKENCSCRKILERNLVFCLFTVNIMSVVELLLTSAISNKSIILSVTRQSNIIFEFYLPWFTAVLFLLILLLNFSCISQLVVFRYTRFEEAYFGRVILSGDCVRENILKMFETKIWRRLI